MFVFTKSFAMLLSACVPATLALQTWVEQVATVSTQGLPNEPNCNATVAYSFLVREGLPLWDVWQDYFDGCLEGSYIIVALTQTPGAAYKDIKSHAGEEVAGAFKGDLRFSYKMVDAMLNLYGGVLRQGVAPNGCAPSWVHMSSEACAPVEPCGKVHKYLLDYEGYSFVKRGLSQPAGVSKSSQWTTLWADHAFALYKDRAQMRRDWADKRRGSASNGFTVFINGDNYKGALDEFVWPVELKKHGFKIQYKNRSLTYAHQEVGESYPLQAESGKVAKDIINEALHQGAMFARKFEGSQAQINALKENLKSRS